MAGMVAAAAPAPMMEKPSSTEKLPPAFAKESCPAAWSKAGLGESANWGRVISKPEMDEMRQALESAYAAGLEFMTLAEDEAPVPMNMTKEMFKAGPALQALADELANELEDGTGAAMLANFPTPADGTSLKDAAAMYVGLCCLMGVPVWQSSAGLRSKSRGYGLVLGHVKAEMQGGTPVAGKQSNNYFRLHTDRCDVISLLCIRPAPGGGGASRVASAITIFNEMREKHPDLAAKLFEPVPRIWEGKGGVVSHPPWAVHAGKFTTQISPSYIECAQLLDSTPKLDADTIEAIDLVEEIGLKHAHEFVMQTGMVYWLNNHSVYHGRTAWKDTVDDAAMTPTDGSGRLLLRVWLSPYNSRPLPDTADMRLLWGDVRAGKPRGGLEPALATGEEFDVRCLRDAMAAKGHVYYSLYPRKFR